MLALAVPAAPTTSRSTRIACGRSSGAMRTRPRRGVARTAVRCVPGPSTPAAAYSTRPWSAATAPSTWAGRRALYAISRTGDCAGRLPRARSSTRRPCSTIAAAYFGSGDGHLYARDARSGAPVWAFPTEPPEVTGAFINWFEATSRCGRRHLIAPNDNFRIYAIARDDGQSAPRAFERPGRAAVPATSTARRPPARSYARCRRGSRAGSRAFRVRPRDNRPRRRSRSP